MPGAIGYVLLAVMHVRAYIMINFEWDPRKATRNLAKHGVCFADATAVFFDDLASDPLREEAIRGLQMKNQYDFSKGKRGAVAKVPPGKTRITIRLDNDILEWFRNRAHAAGGGNYQSMINEALREYLTQDREVLEDTLRRVVREELTGKVG